MWPITFCKHNLRKNVYGNCEAINSRTGAEMKMKCVTDLEGSKIRVHTVIRCAARCGIGRLMLGVNTNVGILNLDGLLVAEAVSKDKSAQSGGKYDLYCE